MTIEILFSEVCNLYGDPQNVTYLSRTLPDAEFIYTALDSVPAFAGRKPDMIVLGSMSEKIQRRVIDVLTPYKDRIEELIKLGCVFLITGNAADIFLEEIDYVTEGIKKKGLGLFPGKVTCDLFRRVNGKVIGSVDGITVTGFRSQFTTTEADNEKCAFIEVERGIGINKYSSYEGFRLNNFFATQMLGPILPLNPDFCRYITGLAGADAEPAFYETAKCAFDKRVEEFRNPETKF